jgi:hypothetical protein
MVQNLRLMDLFEVLNKEEVADFQRFVKSPYFHKGVMQEEMTKLLQVLLQKKKAGSEEDFFDRKEAFAIIYPGQTYSEGKIDKVLAALHQTLKQFISVHRYTQPAFEVERKLNQLAFYRERGLQNRYENLAPLVQEEVEEQLQENLGQLKRQFETYYELYRYELQYNVKKSHLNFQRVLESLESSHLAFKLELLNTYLTISQYSAIHLPEEIAFIIDNSFFPENLIHQHPLLHLTYNAFLLFRAEVLTVHEVEDLRLLFLQYENRLEPPVIRQFLTFLRNICYLGIQKNRQAFLPLLFVLSKEDYQRGYLYHDGKMTPTTLMNVSQSAFLNKDLEWCSTFILEQHGKVLNDTPEDGYYHLALANLYFYQGRYEDALDIIPASLPTIDLHLMARRLELKCYYEIQSAIFESKLEAFKVYLSRSSKNLISPPEHQRNNNFLNLLTQIQNTAPGNTSRIQKLSQRIDEKGLLSEQEWLREKVELLGKR